MAKYKRHHLSKANLALLEDDRIKFVALTFNGANKNIVVDVYYSGKEAMKDWKALVDLAHSSNEVVLFDHTGKVVRERRRTVGSK